jgi:hypothetical protein
MLSASRVNPAAGVASEEIGKSVDLERGLAQVAGSHLELEV